MVHFSKIEDNTRKGRTKSMNKEMVVYVQSVLVKKKFAVIIEDGKKKEISGSLMFYVWEKEDYGEEVDKNISALPKRWTRWIVKY